MSDFTRRDFLKIGAAGTATAILAGCSQETERFVTLEPYVRAPEEQLAGNPTFYASTCRMCPAACGILPGSEVLDFVGDLVGECGQRGPGAIDDRLGAVRNAVQPPDDAILRIVLMDEVDTPLFGDGQQGAPRTSQAGTTPPQGHGHRPCLCACPAGSTGRCAGYSRRPCGAGSGRSLRHRLQLCAHIGQACIDGVHHERASEGGDQGENHEGENAGHFGVPSFAFR